MSVSGLEHSEKLAKALLRKILASLRRQSKAVKLELEKVRYLLADPEQVKIWLSNPADKERILALQSLLDETEQLYLTNNHSEAAKLFKARTKSLLEGKLSNLQSYETEIRLRMNQLEEEIRTDVLKGLNGIKKDAAFREIYSEAHQAGGFYVNIGKAYLQDIVTLETKAAGSKTLGEYMRKLFVQYEKGLRDVMVDGIVRGDSYEQMAKNLSKSTGVSMRKAQLLVNTESNAVFNSAVADVIEENPLVIGYRFRATLDSHTSKICQEMDGQFIPKEDIQPGVNYPPLHPNCRSTVVTVLAGEDVDHPADPRWTKDENSNWIAVPPGMSYKEYKEKYLNGH